MDCVKTLRGVVDRRFAVRAGGWSLLAFLAYGIVAAIIPNPVFGRAIPPEPFAIGVWVLSAPLMGLVAATYRLPADTRAARPLTVGPAVPDAAARPGETRGSTAAAVGSMAAFVAIGCPVCNKVALLLLGASGAVTVFAPWQPVIGVASILLLALTLAWRFRMLASGPACAVPSPRA